ncbi:hypothetical protein NQ318_004790 [Aromia moschata]|uniref:Kinesin-like protein n=1 Tax=Aromia moschata TaxID=1265417 RepID=A0AAV8XQU4_9CUCU|nr:hypothetical protein NQ318_004790 [Aromia moschata]
MDGSKSRLPKPSGIRLPQNRPKPLTENKANVLEHRAITTASRLALHRRSKSVSDLRSLMDRPRMVPKINSILGTKAAAAAAATAAVKVAQKRKVEKGSDEVKPKVMKHAKIPDWDYKSRFNQLREKHTVLNENYKKQLEKLQDVEDLETKYEEIKKQHETLEQKSVILSSKNLDLTKDNKLFKTQISERLKKNYETLKQNYDELVEQERKNTERIEKLTAVNEALESSLQDLTENHEILTMKHEKLTAEHSAMRADYEKMLVDNKSLNDDLEKEKEKCVQLSDHVSNLKKDVYSSEILRRRLHNTVQDLKGNIRVFCRVRPPISAEEEERLQCLINYIDEKSFEIRKSRESVSAISGKPNDLKAEFALDRVFDPNSTQNEVFEDLSQLVQSALDGYDICVFAYGQTGSGKTYTMQGEPGDEAGLIPRTIDLIFNSIGNLQRTGWTYDVKASFLEIYNENVRDLLNPTSGQNLEIRYNEGKGTTVTNLIIQSITSARELKTWMATAHQNRAVAATDFNEHSSRSHAVTKIYLQGYNEDTNTRYVGSINLVDLAGSESAKTSANERLTETKSINKSLSTLGSVMLALYNKEKHIPYRNSKLTYLLQSSLGGSSKTLMVVNISPFEDCYMETINSLRFAAKVKEVKMVAKRNKTNLPSVIGKT